MLQIVPLRSGTQVAGQSYSLSCIAVKAVNGLTEPALTQWQGVNMAPINSGGTIAVADAVYMRLRTTQLITYQYLLTSHAGVYTCSVTLSSPALPSVYQTMESYTITVSSEIICV